MRPAEYENGYGDGDDHDHIAHPYIHYAGDASCGYHSLETNLRISLHYMYGALGSGQWTRVYYNHCGFGYNCHDTLGLGDHDCKYAATYTPLALLPITGITTTLPASGSRPHP